jgi:hypothetical protein
MRCLFAIAVAFALLGGADVLAGLSSDRPAPIASSQDDARIDYELAERVGTREVWTSFLSRHSTGFYADLARGKLKAIEANEQAERLKAIEEQQRAKSANAKSDPAGRRGGRSCTSTHAECVQMSTPYGPRWIGNCGRLRNVCMQTGRWNSGLRSYSNVERR